ncbi:SET domain-containing protein [Backusella circina FSU 941]|nr:SET domain-containing protein [Backusella circina FSU 941]
MNMDFIGPQIDTAPIVAIIRDQIVKQRDPSKAALEFLKMPFFQDYLQDKTEKRKLEFTQHLKRYMYMFMPNAGFEISSTDRYTGQLEACIVATRDWEAGEQVTCCQGAIAELNKEEDAKLKKEGRDFSVMVSTRKKCTCLFLGPARFMNHDCDANCEFIQLNQNAITFRIKRNITEGEEMTVFYGEHYFGEDNCECLCASCEK